MTSLTAAARGPEVSSAARSATVGRPINGCLAWKHRAIGRISATSASASSILCLSTRTKTDGIGLFTGQIGYAWNQALFYVKGGAAVTSNRFSILDTFSGVELASASATRWGGTVGVGFEYGFAPNWSFGVEYNHLFMGDANNSFTGLTPVAASFAQQPDHPRRGHGHLAHQLPLRRLRRTGRSEILTSRYFDFSSKLGRQKCRPFCWRLHV